MTMEFKHPHTKKLIEVMVTLKAFIDTCSITMEDEQEADIARDLTSWALTSACALIS